MRTDRTDPIRSAAGRQQSDRCMDLEVIVLRAADATLAQHAAVRRLQDVGFGHSPAEALTEDFVAEPFARVLASDGAGELVGTVSVFQRVIEYEGQRLCLGGFGGTCTRADRRGRGIGTAVCRAALALLHAAGCDAAALAAAPGTRRFYGRLGFVPLGKPYTFVNARGATKQPGAADDGMLAPVRSREQFERILRGRSPLHLGPEPGYW
jgi:predicted N-acetyltransferase YhbS